MTAKMMREGTLVGESEVARQDFQVRYRRHGLIRVHCHQKRLQPLAQSEHCDVYVGVKRLAPIRFLRELHSRDGCAAPPLAPHSHGICANFSCPHGVVRHSQSSICRPIDPQRPPVVARLIQSNTSPTCTFTFQLSFFQADLSESPGERAI